LSRHKKSKGRRQIINSSKPRDDMHHIIPRSRGGATSKKNLVEVNYELHHNCYHKLFGNMTPEEICIYLTKEWWNGDASHLKSALAEVVGQ